MLGYINQNTVANDARMRRTRFAGSFVLVEGRADQKLYGKFIVKERCQILLCGSKQQVLAAVDILQGNLPGVIAIIDADFAHAAGEVPEHDNIFMTDGHDAEMMILSTRAVAVGSERALFARQATRVGNKIR